MGRGKIDRALLIKKAAELFNQKGYNNTTMDDIAQACHIQKSSLYHHVPSRKALILMVVKHAIHCVKEECFKSAYSSETPVKERLKMLAEATEAFFNRSHYSHLLISLTVDNDHNFPEVKNLITSYFDDWIAALTYVLSEQYPITLAKKIGEETVSYIQGAALLAKAYNNQEMLTRATHRLENLLTLYTTDQTTQAV